MPLARGGTYTIDRPLLLAVNAGHGHAPLVLTASGGQSHAAPAHMSVLGAPCRRLLRSFCRARERASRAACCDAVAGQGANLLVLGPVSSEEPRMMLTFRPGLSSAACAWPLAPAGSQSLFLCSPTHVTLQK